VYLDPPVVIAGRTTTVELVGTNTEFDDALEIQFGDPADPLLERRDLRVDSAVHARIQLFVQAGAVDGLRDVIVRTGRRA